MYKLSDIKDIHIELTNRCQARCPMCPRRLSGGMLNPMLVLDEITLDDFKNWFSIDFVKQLNSILLCGNYGEPIVAQDCLEILKYLRENNSNLYISIHTNGSARTVDWWRELATLRTTVVFGIDGLKDTHHLYRIDTDFDKIIENARAFIQAGGRAEWHMLVFKHNEHQIELCENLSKELGFEKFSLKHTTRFMEEEFFVLDDLGRSKYILEPTEKSKQMIGKGKESIDDLESKINCKALNSNQIYISATGTVSPCCWLDLEFRFHIQDTRIDYMNKIGEFPNLRNKSLSEIFDSGFFNKIESTWSCDTLKECSKQCGKFDRVNAQFK